MENSNVISEEMIFSNVSPGSFGYLKTLSDTKSIKYKWNIFLINTMTLARNIISYIKNDNPNFKIITSNVPYDIIAEYISKDIEIITIYIKKYINNLSNTITLNNTKYRVIFYFPNYIENVKINPTVYKQPTKVFKENIIIYNKLYQQYINKNIKFNTAIKKDNLIYYSFLNPHKYASVDLYQLINNSCKFNSRFITVLTHIPIDYFIIKFFPYISFIDSYTGKILSSKEDISKKLFKSEYIPFSKYSHYLFGDKYLLRSHFPKRGQKKELLYKALNYKWNLLTDEQFKSKIIDMNLIDNKSFNYHPY